MKWKHPFDEPRDPNQQNLMNGDQDAESSAELAAKQLAKQKALAARTALIARIENDFKYHSPKGDQPERYDLIRNTALKLARVMVECCPNSRELSTALTNLETAVMHANAAIARNPITNEIA